MDLNLAIDPGWAYGLLLAQIRCASFVVSSPQIGSALPGPGRMAFVLAMGLALTRPIQVETMGQLVGFAAVNAVVGLLLGYMAGLLFHVFAIAGALVDLSAATSIASVLDPTRGEQGAVFSRMFQMAGLTLFHIGGGMTLLVTGLGWSIRTVPLDGQIAMNEGLVGVVLELIGTVMIAGFELAAPVVAALFLIELTLGLAARFAPTANVFLLGMPVKVGVAMVVSVTCFGLFPQFTTALTDSTRDTMVDVLNGIGVPAV